MNSLGCEVGLYGGVKLAIIGINNKAPERTGKIIFNITSINIMDLTFH